MKSYLFTVLFLIAALLISPLETAANAAFDAQYIDPVFALEPDARLDDAGAQAVSLPSEASQDWWTAVQENIQREEYSVTWQEHTYLADLDAAYQAPNRAQNLRTYFTPQGIRVIPRVFDGDTPPWEWQLALNGYGCAGDIQLIDASAEIVANQNHVEYQRAGMPTEWYRNDESGLEQGFTLTAPPKQGCGAGVILNLALGGTLHPVLASEGDAIEFATDGGVTVLRYGELAVLDAAGKPLPAQFALTAEGIQISIETAGAVYPVTVDPLAETPNWTAESNQTEANFSKSVGTAGDVNGDGYADVIVSANTYSNGQAGEGRAFVYHGGTTGLAASPAWTAEGDQDYALFGYSVGTAGDVNGDGYADVIIGAVSYDGDQADAGRVYVYHGGATGLTVGSADWTAEGSQEGAAFGWAVGTIGDVNGDGYADVIIGEPYGGEEYEGRVYVYQGGSTGLTTGPAGWTAESNQIYGHFGEAVGPAGDVNGDGYTDVIIGASGYGSLSGGGRAFVYHGSSTGLTTGPANWTAEGDQANAQLGYSVGTAGDVNGDGYADVIVGVPSYDGGQADEGRAYVYYGSSAGLSTIADWMIEGDCIFASVGISVGTAGDVNGDGYADVVVGALWYDGSQQYEGRVYVYYGSSKGLITGPADWTAEGGQADAQFGWSAGTAGDVNGDGYSDVIIGSPGYSNGEAAEGRAFVYYGSSLGLTTGPADWTAESDQVNAQFGISVGTAGDVNGDGYSDVIIGAYWYDNGETDEGRVYVYYGSSTGLTPGPADWVAEGDQDGSGFGVSVGTAGDVNGDGYSDVIVGAWYYDGDQEDEGRVFVYHGSAAGLSTTADWSVESDQAGARLGSSVGTAGDVNGDGYADVIVGVPYYANGQTDEGRAYVYFGGSGGLTAGPADWTAEGDRADARFGYSVGTAGDVNGDGYAEVIIGAPYYDDGRAAQGRAYVYYGNEGNGLSLRPRQMRTDGPVHIAPLGISDSTTAVQLHLTGRMPLGREKVKLQWQVAPLGSPFTATMAISGTSAAWTDVLTTGVVITQNVIGLTPLTPYHWRIRLLYRPGNRLGQSAGRWVHIPWNGWAEQDFRTAEWPIAGLVASNDGPTPLGGVTTLTATVTAGSNVSYTWAFGDGAIGSGQVVTHTYPAAGLYTAVVTASNSVSVLTATTTVTMSGSGPAEHRVYLPLVMRNYTPDDHG